MLAALILLCAVGTLNSVPVDRPAEKCGYESCTKPKPGFVNVHIVPHTHDDVGWLKTVDQYYYGSNDHIQKAGVQYILSSVVNELWEDPRRKFIYVESAFFWKWWQKQTLAVQQKVHTLVAQGRLQFVGGAWSMNDEANVNYQTTVDQFTWGLRKLNATFGECGRPRVGWQIDPFGHSREFASLLAGMGYDGLFLGRIDFQDKENRLLNKNMETLWRGDDTLGERSDIFTGVLYNTYSPPPGFCFDVLCEDDPIVDDPNSPEFNLDKKMDEFLGYVWHQSLNYRTGNVLVTMGGDFTYQDATMWYSNLDKLIENTNLKAAKDGLNVTLFYSTPTCYLKAVHDADPALPPKQDDFFPYASDPASYWTGYFTSRPTTKYFERLGNNYLQALKQLQVLGGLQKHNEFVLDELKSAIGIMQHHDAITGTEKQHVTSDYERILTQSIDDALLIADQAFNKIQNGSVLPLSLHYSRCLLNESSCSVSENSNQFVVTIYNPLAFEVTDVPVSVPVVGTDYTVNGPDVEKLYVQLYEIPKAVQNIPTRKSNATHEVVFLTDLKPLSIKSFVITKQKPKHKREVTEKRNYDYYYNLINNQWKDLMVDIKKLDESLPGSENNENYKSYDVEALNREVERIKHKVRKDTEKSHEEIQNRKNGLDDLTEEEINIMLGKPKNSRRYFEEYPKFAMTIGNKTHLIRLIDANSFKIDNDPTYTIDFAFYNGSRGDNHAPKDRASGAYIFRPTSTFPTILNKDCITKVIEGPIFNEHQRQCSTIYNSLRLYHGVRNKFLEVDWVAGPIPVEDKMGKEYVLRIGSHFVTNGEVFTDSNGRQVLKRKLNQRPQYNGTILEPVAGNYYPVSSHIFLESDAEANRLVVIPDRPEGGGSLSEGEIELMLHRRLLDDDGFGVAEALDEVADGKGLVVRGSHDIFLHPKNRNDLRNLVLQRQLKPIVLFADATHLDYNKVVNGLTDFSFMLNDLPYGLHLLTLEPWDDKLLIRIENYLDGKNKDLVVDLNDIFKDIKLKNYRETVLSANQYLNDSKRFSWKVEKNFVKDFNKAYGSFGPVETVEGKDENVENVERSGGTKIKLKSQQIRTFIAEYEFI